MLGVRSHAGLLALVFGLVWAGPAQAQPSGAAEVGLELLRNKGCVACHSLDGTKRVGPSLLGLFGTTRTGIDAQGAPKTALFDADYLRESLEAPGAFRADAMANAAMPPFTLNDAEHAHLLAAVAELADATPAAEGTLWYLVVGALAFVGFHLGLSSQALRPTLVARLGARAFQGLYSLVVLIAFGVMLWGYGEAPYVPIWSPPAWTRYVPLCLMPVVMVLMVLGFSTKNPTAAGQERAVVRGPSGIVAITRHPGLWSFALWGLAHLTTNGDAAEMILFVAIVVLSIGGMFHIDARRQQQLGDRWGGFAAQTSLVPFVALAQGRVRLRLAELGWGKIAVALVLYAAVLHFHARLFGASPLPF